MCSCIPRCGGGIARAGPTAAHAEEQPPSPPHLFSIPEPLFFKTALCCHVSLAIAISLAQGSEDGTVYRWHVDSLMGGRKDMDVVPLMQEGVGKLGFQHRRYGWSARRST